MINSYRQRKSSPKFDGPARAIAGGVTRSMAIPFISLFFVSITFDRARRFDRLVVLRRGRVRGDQNEDESWRECDPADGAAKRLRPRLRQKMNDRFFSRGLKRVLGETVQLSRKLIVSARLLIGFELVKHATLLPRAFYRCNSRLSAGRPTQLPTAFLGIQALSEQPAGLSVRRIFPVGFCAMNNFRAGSPILQRDFWTNVLSSHFAAQGGERKAQANIYYDSLSPRKHSLFSLPETARKDLVGRLCRFKHSRPMRLGA